MPIKPSPGVYFWRYPVFEAVGYSEIQRDTAGYSWIQVDTVGYSGIQWDIVEYSGFAAKWLTIDRYGHARDMQAGYRDIQAENPKKYTQW